MLVVIADATDEDNITRLVSATTDIIFTSGGAVGDTASPAFNETPSSRSPPPAHGRSQTAQRVGGDTAYEKGREKGRGDSKRPGGLGQRQRLLQTGGSDEESLWRSIGGPTGGASCPPLTVIVSHGEGRRVLDWLVTVGSGVVTASVAERDDVGKLWGDVVWASDPANWPKGARIVVLSPSAAVLIYAQNESFEALYTTTGRKMVLACTAFSQYLGRGVSFLADVYQRSEPVQPFLGGFFSHHMTPP